MSTPDPKPRHCISIDLVVGFYESDNSSRMMPGRKDFVSVKQIHGRVQIQKRLILCNLIDNSKMNIRVKILGSPSLQTFVQSTVFLLELEGLIQFVFALYTEM